MKQNFINSVLICLFTLLSMTIKSQNQNDSIVVSTEGITGYELSKDAIFKNPNITCSDKDIEITEYSVAFHDQTGTYVKYNGKGNMLKSIIVKEIQAMDSGEVLSLEAIAVNKIDGKTYELFSEIIIIN